MNDPDLGELLYRQFHTLMSDVHTAIPGVVDSYDKATRTAKVVPTIKRIRPNGNAVELPAIVEVPVMFMGTADTVIRFPILKGTGVLLVFSERSLDRWATSDGKSSVEPGDLRRFALTDAIAIPGLNPKGATVPGTGDGLEIVHKNVTISISDGGKVKIDASSLELLGAVNDLVTHSALNSALSMFLTQLTLAMTTTPIVGNGAPQPVWTGLPTSIDISAAKAANIKVG